MIELHYYPGNASLFPHMLLRELEVPFVLRLVDRDAGAQTSPAYLKLNPNGKIPVLIDGEVVIYETAAIALYLTDTYPQKGLSPPPGTPQRADYYRWMVHLSNTPQAEFRAWFYPHEFTTDPDGVAGVKTATGLRLSDVFGRIEGLLGAGPWLLGERFSAADLYLLMMTRWGRTLPNPIRDLPNLGAHAARVLARPAVAATFKAEGLEAPFV
ncbi:glutathione S-transferase family protein [Phenylobacterium aquaticum]|uniref:glutathione S-transferase family protein n=1 Tax=Phenylobacterium aquaticum TaxID=1763816 RepID=UPI0026F0520D|nr:glutathione S-transferase family protein [Phenylobacterium aquaticum]